MFVLLTFVIGNVPQRRVAGVTFALALTEASFNPALWKQILPTRLNPSHIEAAALSVAMQGF